MEFLCRGWSPRKLSGYLNPIKLSFIIIIIVIILSRSQYVYTRHVMTSRMLILLNLSRRKKCGYKTYIVGRVNSTKARSLCIRHIIINSMIHVCSNMMSALCI